MTFVWAIGHPVHVDLIPPKPLIFLIFGPLLQEKIKVQNLDSISQSF
jgi:hypothetical protein